MSSQALKLYRFGDRAFDVTYEERDLTGCTVSVKGCTFAPAPTVVVLDAAAGEVRLLFKAKAAEALWRTDFRSGSFRLSVLDAGGTPDATPPIEVTVQ